MSIAAALELQIVPVMVGTAGHVDHGKTALVKLLTGCDTDHLPEEKKRGMSIDLGFAPLQLASSRMVGIIDVPGHEDFIRNMVAGASSIDVLVLVIAADDGIMPQTVEHLKIVSLLGTPRVLAVITKIDLVTAARQQEVRAAVVSFLDSNGFAGAPVILMSNKTKDGLAEVKQAIERLVHLVQQDVLPSRAFRMHVERAFSPPGVGTVIAGIPSSGQCCVGERLELFPGPQRTACRSVQKYSYESKSAQAHTCCAVTIRDIKATDVQRGMTLAAPGIYQATSSAVLSVENVHDTCVIKRRQEMRFCCGTFTRVVWGLLIGKNSLAPGENGFMQVESALPMVVAAGDRFLLRSLSPSVTLGGGSVLTRHIDPRRKKLYLTSDRLEKARKAVADHDPFLSELSAGCYVVISATDLPWLVQNAGEEITTHLAAQVRSGVLTPLGPAHWIVNDRKPELEEKLAGILARFHKENKTAAGMPGAQVCAALGLEEACQEGLKGLFANSLRILLNKAVYRLSDFTPDISAKLQGMKDQLMKSVAQAGNAALAQAVLQAQLSATDKEMQLLTRLLSEEGAVTVVDHYLLATTAVQKFLAVLLDLFKEKNIVELADFRTATGLTRNVAVPILELFDAKGVTCREAKGRKLLRRTM